MTCKLKNIIIVKLSLLHRLRIQNERRVWFSYR